MSMDIGEYLETTLSLWRGGLFPGHRVAWTDLPNGIGVSTVDSSDRGYETALCTPTQTLVVERYDGDEATALDGHAAWCRRAAAMKHGDKVTDIGYGPVAAKEHTLDLDEEKP